MEPSVGSSGTWVRLDASYYDDPAVAGLSVHAERLFIRALCVAQRTQTDGVVALHSLRRLDVWKLYTQIHSLVTAGLWVAIHGCDSSCDDAQEPSWQIKSWLKYNRPAQEVAEIRAKRIEGGKLGGRPKKANLQGLQNNNLEGPPLCFDAVKPITINRSRTITKKVPSLVPPATKTAGEKRQEETGQEYQPGQESHVGQLLNEEWRKHNLGVPRGYDWLQGAVAVTTLTAHFSDAEILSAPAKIATTPGLAWVAKRGPAYLAEQAKGSYVLQVVLDWEQYLGKNGRAATEFTPHYHKPADLEKYRRCPE